MILAFVFATSTSLRPGWKRFYRFVPPLLLCYFVPGLLGTLGVFSGDASRLYFVASRYLLPTSLVLLTLSLDLPAIRRLGGKIVVMFLTGTVGVVVGGPLAIVIVGAFAPDVVGGEGPDAVWRGMTTVAGSWIGGGANQTAMKEVFEVGDDVFSSWIAVDVIVANVWLAFLLYGAGVAARIDRWTGADTTAIEALQRKVQDYEAAHRRVPTTADLFQMLAVGFGATALAHLGADAIAPFLETHYPALSRFSLTSRFFWLIVIATSLGVVASFTRFRELEGAGASRVGAVLLYVLVATIGMKMNLLAIFERPGIFVVGAVWITIHAAAMIVVGRLLRAPLFFVAVGSQANIGGAASAPIVASAFHPVLAPVGVMMAVLGYALGTYAAWLCGIAMQAVAP
ncbi:MAG TPA: DUF819 family protein [Sandaracinaceae bacterium LLY-WYZ-13_1]|nr:DUF819 family protein [Sandaracinaceae bacterium LLY-WYZ-13_1]